MNDEPRHQADYSTRQVEAAHRALVDVGQVLASFKDCMVVIGGWVPDLLLPNVQERHVGSIDVDIALDAAKLNDGRYAALLKLLLATKRYKSGDKEFQWVVDVDLQDDQPPVRVPVEFLAPKEVRLKKNRPKLIPGFRVLRTDACRVAFHAPKEMAVSGKTALRGAKNTVYLRIASLSDFLVMKAHALRGREKPKDSYDICYVLDHAPGGIEAFARDWRDRLAEKDVREAIEILGMKFEDVESYGPKQLVEFHDAMDVETQLMQARRAFEVVQKFLKKI